MKIEHIAVKDLHQDPANARKHNQRNLDAIKASLAKYGQQKPVVVGENNVVIAGNGTLEAAIALGWEKIACVRSNLKGTSAVGYAVSDNRTAELAEWDNEVLATTLEGLRSEDFDLAAVGFDDSEVDALLEGLAAEIAGEGADDSGAKIDQAEELQKVWKVKAGDLWEIPSQSVGGKSHRLLCGDSTKPEDVARLMGADKAVLMNTDPPYGIDYAALKNGIPRSGFRDIQETRGDIENDNLTDGEALQTFLEAMLRAAIPHLVDNPAFYFWHPMLTQGTFFAAAAAAAVGILIHRQIIWVKPHMVLTRSGMYHWKHELCFYGWFRGKPCDWLGDKSQVSVWELGESQHGRLHPTQKPVELFVRPIENHVKRGGILYEPFSGSGSQLIAAEQAGRLCRAMEISPKFAAVALQRLSDMGLAPKRA